MKVIQNCSSVLVVFAAVTNIINWAEARIDDIITFEKKIPSKSPARLIVQLSPEYTHDHFENFMISSIAADDMMEVHHRYSMVMYGIVVSGVKEEVIRKHPGVKNVFPDSIVQSPMDLFEATLVGSVRSWGLDRINQPNLPLDDLYRPTYNGSNVDVYVVDSGIDTLHDEFAPDSSGRVVQNYWVPPSLSIVSPNNDDFGHGTHVAGTVGGKTAGVSPLCNIFGVKVLDMYGSGTTSDVIAGLDAIGKRHGTSGKPSIVNMSFIGPCDGGACATDPINIASEALIALGVIVVVASGNSNKNACLSSPASATGAITVAASTRTDARAPFSNYGTCVEIFAPGLEIISACSSLSRSCRGDETMYRTMSGTSMAAPHVAGVAAQVLQMSSALSPVEVNAVLSCLAVKGTLTGVPVNNTNQLLQVPKENDSCVPRLRESLEPSFQPTGKSSVTMTPLQLSDIPSFIPTKIPVANYSSFPVIISTSRPTYRPLRLISTSPLSGKPSAAPSFSFPAIAPSNSSSPTQSNISTIKPSLKPDALSITKSPTPYRLTDLPSSFPTNGLIANRSSFPVISSTSRPTYRPWSRPSTSPLSGKPSAAPSLSSPAITPSNSSSPTQLNISTMKPSLKPDALSLTKSPTPYRLTNIPSSIPTNSLIANRSSFPVIGSTSRPTYRLWSRPSSSPLSVKPSAAPSLSSPAITPSNSSSPTQLNISTIKPSLKPEALSLTKSPAPYRLTNIPSSIPTNSLIANRSSFPVISSTSRPTYRPWSRPSSSPLSGKPSAAPSLSSPAITPSNSSSPTQLNISTMKPSLKPDALSLTKSPNTKPTY